LHGAATCRQNASLVAFKVKEVEMAKAKSPIPEGFHTVTPQLILDNAKQAIDWYKKALGAEEVARATGPDGQILHAELRIGHSRIMLNDAMGGGKGPTAHGGSPMSLWLYVDDCDAQGRSLARGNGTAAGGVDEAVRPAADPLAGVRAHAVSRKG
jgi:uncharacterized glyoxalase superfamily protein PhnB